MGLDASVGKKAAAEAVCAELRESYNRRMRIEFTRRQMLAAAGAAIVSGAVKADSPKAKSTTEIFGYCLNTSTIRGQNLPLPEEIDIAAKVGFGAVEPWIGEIEKFVKSGGSLPDLRKRIADHGLAIPSAIGFAAWIVDDDDRRSKGLEQMRRDMELVAQIGGTRIAAPPVGANGGNDVRPETAKIAERYHAILEIGRQIGVTPELEIWGSSKTLSTLGEAVQIAVQAADAQACVLVDVFHLYKGGSDIAGINLLRGTALGVIHTNDYPATPPREQINDAQRVYPGDGIAPLTELFHILREIGWRGHLSVELFNKDYWKQSPVKVAQMALDKTRAAVQKAFA
jgi:2-keto-myo-inositol isomerase